MVVVVLSPQRQLMASVGHTEEDLHVQALVAQSAVEALDVAVLDRSFWPDEVQVHRILIRPQICGLAGKSLPLSTVMDCGAPRSAIISSNTAATFSPLKQTSANNAKHSRVTWSTTVSTRIQRPSASRWATKSMLHF